MARYGAYRIAIVVVLAALAALLAGCGGSGGGTTGTSQIVEKPLFSFAAIGDPHVGGIHECYYMLAADIGDKLLANAVNDINHRNVDFTLVLGDITNSGRDWQFALAKSVLDGLNKPYIPLVGNHDNFLGDNFAAFHQVFGNDPLNRSWDHKGFHFVTASSESPLHTKPYTIWTDEALSFVRNDLAANAGKPSIFVTHHNLISYTSVWTHGASQRAEEMRAVLEGAPNVMMSLSAHAHRFRYTYKKLGYATIGCPPVYPAKIMYYHVYADRIVSEAVKLSNPKLVRQVNRMCPFQDLRTRLELWPENQQYTVPVTMPPGS